MRALPSKPAGTLDPGGAVVRVSGGLRSPLAPAQSTLLLLLSTQAPSAVQLAHVTAEPAPPVVGAAPLEAGWGKLADQPPKQFIRA